MDLASSGIPLASLVISGGTLVFTAISLRGKVGQEHSAGLERRLERIELELSQCLKRQQDLIDENIQLMRRLVIIPLHPGASPTIDP